MKKRVTITLDPEVHRRARQSARRRQTTVSGLIESLLEGETRPASGGLVGKMVGSASLRQMPVGGDALHEALVAKYLKR